MVVSIESSLGFIQNKLFWHTSIKRWLARPQQKQSQSGS